MKKYYTILLFVFLFLHYGYGQDSSVKLNYMDNAFPIKIDRGGNFYTYDTANLDKQKYILVINDAGNWITAESNTRTAFIKVPDKPGYVYLHTPGHTHAAGMDTAVFKGEGYVKSA